MSSVTMEKAKGVDLVKSPLKIGKYSNTGRRKNCIFCTIAHGEDPKTKLLFKDEDFVAFRNITPAASHHYLIIPKEHIEDGTVLKAYHIPMLIRMEQIAKEVLARQGGHLKPHRLGYHWPPFISVYHLHLHAISPESEMSHLSKSNYRTGSDWFRSTEKVIKGLENRIPHLSSINGLKIFFMRNEIVSSTVMGNKSTGNLRTSKVNDSNEYNCSINDENQHCSKKNHPDSENDYCINIDGKNKYPMSNSIPEKP